MTEYDLPKALALLRSRDLKRLGIAASWAVLSKRIKEDDFPPGRMIGGNSRAWTVAEVERWLDSRPVEGPAPRGVALPGAKRGRRRGRPRKAAPAAQVAAE